MKMVCDFVIQWIILVSTYLGLSEAHFNLFMNETECLRVLGIPGELYYVRNGSLNQYALSFKVTIRNKDIDVLYFNWQNLKNDMMLYQMAITISNDKAMDMPTTSLKPNGEVPKQASLFYITLPCTGAQHTEVDIQIQLNISIYSASNITSITLNRQKMCNLERPNYDVVIKDSGGGNEDHVTDPSYSKVSGAQTNIFYIAIGCACGAILLIALTVFILYLRSHKFSGERFSDTSSAALTHGQYLRADTPNNSVVSGMPSSRRGFSPLPECTAQEVHTILNQIAISRKRVYLGEIIMEGTFGRVYHGTLLAQDDSDVKGEQQVFIKTVTDVARPDQVDRLFKEGIFTYNQDHPNINTLIYSCMDDEKHPLLIYPSSNEGNLKKFLQRCKVTDLGSHQTLNTQQLVYMALQIIRGMQFLHRKRIIHKDLATRNCIVDGQLGVKLTDTALSRDLFPNDYHCLGDNENRPVKWLAIEALLNRTFTPASDVWSFGVCLWELVTMGQQPYADVDPFEMSTYLREGYRISQPGNCPDELFAVMACCWAMNPDERPKMGQLLICLQDFYTALGRFI